MPGSEGWGRITIDGHKGMLFWCKWTVLHLDCGGGYVTEWMLLSKFIELYTKNDKIYFIQIIP